MQVSEYVDKVDILTWKSKTGRIHEQIRDICAILSGLAVAADYEVTAVTFFFSFHKSSQGRSENDQGQII